MHFSGIRFSSSLIFAFALAAGARAAEPAVLTPRYPVGDEVVTLVPAEQQRIMALPTLAERLALATNAAERAFRECGHWRQALPLELRLDIPEAEKGPWKVMIGKRPDLSDARVWYFSAARPNGRFEVPQANLEIATRYYWQVRGKELTTPVASFMTAAVAPRWIALEGKVHNIRDLGGRLGLGGARVKQGMIYRGQGLNDNSVTGEAAGRNRLTMEDVAYLTGTLGIKTDLDLRSRGETADLSVSPLGEKVRLILRSSSCYKWIFNENGMKVMAENFRVFCDPANYPVYFHCIGGADRTGSLAYVLNAVLGVSRHELETDWESTFYPNIPDANPDPDFWCRESHFNVGFAQYGDASTTWNERVVLYLKACGITEEEIAAFRAIMLE